MEQWPLARLRVPAAPVLIPPLAWRALSLGPALGPSQPLALQTPPPPPTGLGLGWVTSDPERRPQSVSSLGYAHVLAANDRCALYGRRLARWRYGNASMRGA